MSLKIDEVIAENVHEDQDEGPVDTESSLDRNRIDGLGGSEGEDRHH